MATILEWRDTLLDVGSIGFPKTIEASGAYTALIGSRPTFAKLVLKFERANEFEVDISSFGTNQRLLTYAHSAIFGAIDVLMTSHAYSISKVKITVLKIEDDEVQSTPRAFRLAAREATRKALIDVGLMP